MAALQQLCDGGRTARECIVGGWCHNNRPPAAQQALSRIIPSPRKEMPENRPPPGVMLMVRIPQKPKRQPAIFFTLKVSSSRNSPDRIIRKNEPMESRIVERALGI